MIRISVIIPVKNGEATLKLCLKSIKEQTVADQIEIIILDSNSNDNSLSIAKEFGATIIHIEPSTFNHGDTRNVGAKAANGELLYYTVQDARLSSTDMLANMAAHFEDANVQAVNGIQGVPSERDKNPAVWFKRFSKPTPEIRDFKKGEFAKLSPKEQLEYCRWDNVNAMYRKQALLDLPFRNINFAEDALWSFDALSRGFKLVRDSSLLVYHYHHHDFQYTFRVVFIINYNQNIYFNSLPSFPNFFKASILNSYHIVRKKEIGFAEKLYWVKHNFIRHLAHFLAVLTFRTLHLFGTGAVEKGLQFFCATVPQGQQIKVVN